MSRIVSSRNCINPESRTPSYRISNRARQDLISIWNYTYDTWSADQADKYIIDLMNEFTLITRLPGKGRSYEEVHPGLFGVRKNKHIIFYRVLPKGNIEIIRILHQQMDLSNRLKD